MIADLRDRQPDVVTPFIIVNFSHHEHLHLSKDHVVAFADGRSQNTVPIASTQVVIKGIVQYSTKTQGSVLSRTVGN